MKQVSKTFIISISILGVILLIVSALLVSLDITSSSSSKNKIPIELLNNGLNNVNDQYMEYNMQVSSTVDYNSSSTNHGSIYYDREITKPIPVPAKNYARINPGIVGPAIKTPLPNYAPISPRTIKSPTLPNYAPITPGVVGPAITPGPNYAPIKSDSYSAH